MRFRSSSIPLNTSMIRRFHIINTSDGGRELSDLSRGGGAIIKEMFILLVANHCSLSGEMLLTATSRAHKGGLGDRRPGRCFRDAI